MPPVCGGAFQAKQGKDVVKQLSPAFCHPANFFPFTMLVFQNRIHTFDTAKHPRIDQIISDMEKIDKLDHQILNIISKNARIPFKEVAEECGVSRAAIHQRVQRLIDMKVIVGSGYHISPKVIGYNTCAYIGVKLEKGSMYKDVVPEIEKIPEVVECHFTTGPYTMLVKLFARDNEHLMELLNAKIQEIPGVTETETLISLRQNIKREIPINKKDG